MNKLAFLIVFSLVSIVAYSQKPIKVSATYTYYAPETMSIEEAKRVALDRAKIQAIADEFGTIVSQSTSTILTNSNGASDTQFFSLGGSDIKGEWIETIGEPTFQISFDKELIVKCSVNGYVRAINSETVEIAAKLLRNGTTVKYESDEFKVGDEMYLSIQSPLDGFIMVFWIDYKNEKVYRILPYQGDSNVLMPISKDRNYIFFSPSCGDDAYSAIVDEFVMTCDSNIEYNEVCILFNEKKFSANNIDGISEGIKWTSLENFRKWLAKKKMKLTTLSTVQLNLTIKQQ